MNRNPSLICIAVAFFPLVVASAAPPASAPSTQPGVESKEVTKDGVAVTILLKQPTISANQQPEFTVRFKNVGSSYRNLYDVTAYWNWTIDLTNTDPNATDPGPWRLQMNSIPHRIPIEHRQIKPGESTDVTVNLNDPPFTLKYTYAGPMAHLVADTRQLKPGHYLLTATVTLTNPFGEGSAEWVGPVTTPPIETVITDAPPKLPTKEELAAFDMAIAHITTPLQRGGVWMNGGSPRIDLPKSAATEDVIDAAINQRPLASKAYHLLHVQPFAPKNMPGVTAGSAALLQVGKSYNVVILLPFETSGWWTRFYDTELTPPPGAATKP